MPYISNPCVVGTWWYKFRILPQESPHFPFDDDDDDHDDDDDDDDDDGKNVHSYSSV